MQSKISDPDLYRLFENSCQSFKHSMESLLTPTVPNTLDTAIGWQGVAANDSAEELTFIITGDMYVLGVP